MKPLDHIKEYSPAALFGRAKARLPKAEAFSRYAPRALFSRVKARFLKKETASAPMRPRFTPPVPAGKR